MNGGREPDPDRPVRYLLTWPASMAEQVAQAARTRTMPIAVWMREVIRKELERQEEGEQQ